MMLNRKTILLALGAIVVVAGLWADISYLSSTHSVTVNFSDATNVFITTTGGTTHQVATVSKSGDSVRLANNTDYQVTYKGTTGFASGSVPLHESDSSVTIAPDYSAEKYATIIPSALQKAHELIVSKYPNTDSLFTVTSGGMLERGKWFLVKLTHKGDYTYTSDNLKILLQNVNGKWQLSTKPDIILTQPAYPSLPLNVLSWADQQ